MLIDSFVPVPDAAEKHSIQIAANREAVYQALRTTDFGRSWIVKGLLLFRSLPKFLRHPFRRAQANRRITLQTIIDAGFGVLAEAPNREIVLGVTGPFWRPAGNVLPFNEENFRGAVPPGVACAVWNFAVEDVGERRTILSTETRIISGDSSSRRKFRAYWLLVRPFSGLIRRLMLRAVRRAVR
ncbi:MAG TPA: hypothetical protein VGJ55_13830 [Pyrinomonadaceae bacterium]|jgi:hypothetical protein